MAWQIECQRKPQLFTSAAAREPRQTARHSSIRISQPNVRGGLYGGRRTHEERGWILGELILDKQMNLHNKQAKIERFLESPSSWSPCLPNKLRVGGSACSCIFRPPLGRFSLLTVCKAPPAENHTVAEEPQQPPSYSLPFLHSFVVLTEPPVVNKPHHEPFSWWLKLSHK